MSSFLRRHQKSIFFATLTIFFGGMFVGFGGYWFTDRDMQGVAARVGKVKITNEALMDGSSCTPTACALRAPSSTTRKWRRSSARCSTT